MILNLVVLSSKWFLMGKWACWRWFSRSPGALIISLVLKCTFNVSCQRGIYLQCLHVDISGVVGGSFVGFLFRRAKFQKSYSASRILSATTYFMCRPCSYFAQLCKYFSYSFAAVTFCALTLRVKIRRRRSVWATNPHDVFTVKLIL